MDGGPLPLPSALQQVALLEPQLAERLADDFRRLTRVSEALAWAHGKLPAVLLSDGEGERLSRLVDIARALTGAPEVWAVTWEGELHTGQASFRTLAGDTAGLAAPSVLSQSIIAEVSRSGRPSWTDDATADARFRAAESVQAYQLRSVGCLPLGPHGVLYLHDGTQPGRFTVHDRLRLSALCAAVAPLLEPAPRPRSAAAPALGPPPRAAPHPPDPARISEGRRRQQDRQPRPRRCPVRPLRRRRGLAGAPQRRPAGGLPPEPDRDARRRDAPGDLHRPQRRHTGEAAPRGAGAGGAARAPRPAGRTQAP